GVEHRAAGSDRGLQAAHVVAERFAESAWFQEIALHVDDHQRGAVKVDPERRRFCLDAYGTHGLPRGRCSMDRSSKFGTMGLSDATRSSLPPPAGEGKEPQSLDKITFFKIG